MPPLTHTLLIKDQQSASTNQDNSTASVSHTTLHLIPPQDSHSPLILSTSRPSPPHPTATTPRPPTPRPPVSEPPGRLINPRTLAMMEPPSSSSSTTRNLQCLHRRDTVVTAMTARSSCTKTLVTLPWTQLMSPLWSPGAMLSASLLPLQLPPQLGSSSDETYLFQSAGMLSKRLPRNLHSSTNCFKSNTTLLSFSITQI